MDPSLSAPGKASAAQRAQVYVYTYTCASTWPYARPCPSP
jgi:hypothetical protein